LNTSHLFKYTPALFLLLLSFQIVGAQTRRFSSRSAIVVDERLAVLRSAPQVSAPLLKRLGRGRSVTVIESRRSRDGLVFFRVAVTRRTRGWIQHEALISPGRKGDDARLLSLINASTDFDRIARARIFLDAFPHSGLRPQVLLLFGDEVEKTAEKLSREAGRRLNAAEIAATGAPIASYFLNYTGLDRYRRQGIVLTFDEASRQFHYEGAAWRELLRRYPATREAITARRRLSLR
jgi:hypothetical protein